MNAIKTLAKWTLEDYHRMVDAGILADRPVELLAGEIIEMSPEGPIHRFYSEGLAGYFRSRLTGRAWIQEARPITLSDSEPEPDVSIVRSPRERYRDRHPSADDIFLVVEVSFSSLAKDLEIKTKLYAEAEIEDYWVIDLTKRQFIVLRSPYQGTYQSRQELQCGAIAPIAFPDVELSIEDFWA